MANVRPLAYGRSAMRCGRCGAHADLEDNFCRYCGATLRAQRLPIKRERTTVPSVWRRAAPAVVQGAAMLAVGVAAEWLLRSAARRALSLPRLGRRPAKGETLPTVRKELPPAEGVAVSEMIIMKRVTLRR